MSWAEVKTLEDKMSDLANGKIRIEGGEDLAGTEVIVKRYDSDYMKVPLDTTGEAEIAVTPKSMYHIVSNDGDESKHSDNFEVGAGEFKTVKLTYKKYDGETVTPLNDAAIWLACAGLQNTFSYTSISDILGDLACLSLLYSDANACKYLARSTGSIMDSILLNENASLLMSHYHTVQVEIMKSGVWADAIFKSDYHYGVWEYELPRAEGNSGNEKQIKLGTGLVNVDYLMAQLSNMFNGSPKQLDNADYFGIIASSSSQSGYPSLPTYDFTMNINLGKYKVCPKCIYFDKRNYSSGEGAFTFLGKRADNGEWEELWVVKSYDTVYNDGKTQAEARSKICLSNNDIFYTDIKISINGWRSEYSRYVSGAYFVSAWSAVIYNLSILGIKEEI